MENKSPTRPLLIAALALSLFFVVVGAKWATLDRFGSDIPHWDQWDAECLYLLVPWFGQDHFVQHLFHPHNEHRIVVTKLQNLALTLLNGQWDTRLECVTNAAVHAALAVAFWLVGRRWLAPRWHAPLFIVLAALFGLPLGWQNILGGFHSQQYWLLGLSFAAMVALPFARPWSAAWWAAAAVASLAMFTMASGFFAAAVVFAVVVFRWLLAASKRSEDGRAAWPTLVFAAALVAIGLLTRVTVDYHEPLKAKTAHDFFLYLARSLQWPSALPYNWPAAVLWLPWVLVAWRVLRSLAASRRLVAPKPGEDGGEDGLVASKRSEDGRAGQTIVALGAWVLLQLLATAYARGANADFPASRYMDTLGFGIAVNALALGWLLTGTTGRRDQGTTGQKGQATPTPGASPRFRRTLRLLVPWSFGLSWLIVLVCGLYTLTAHNLRVELPPVQDYYRKAEAHVRGYLATDDPAQLAFEEISFPGAGALIERLAYPLIRELMPVSEHTPLPLRPAPASPSASSGATAFLEDHASQLHLETALRRGISPDTGPLASLPTWGSFGANGAANTGEWTSAPLTAPLGGWLKFEVAGNIGEPGPPADLSAKASATADVSAKPGVSLELRDARTHAPLSDIRPTKVPGHTWRAAYVRAPRVPFVVVARDTDPQRWLAFSAPVEMGVLSHAAWLLAKNGLLVAELAAAAAVLLGLAALLPRRVG